MAESLIARSRAARAELVETELEQVALRRFRDHGFATVTVEEIAAEVGISVRTFYRYFPSKEDVLQVRIRRRSAALADSLAARPDDEPPIRALQAAATEAFAHDDLELLRTWTDVVAAAPALLRGVLGGIQLQSNRVIAEFLAARLGEAPGAFAPTVLAAAIGGVVQEAHTRWYLEGGDLADILDRGLAVLEQLPGVASAPRRESTGRS